MNAIEKLCALRDVLVHSMATSTYDNHIASRFALIGAAVDTLGIPQPRPDSDYARKLRDWWSNPQTTNSPLALRLTADLAPSVIRTLDIRSGRTPQPEPAPSPSRARLLGLFDHYAPLVANAADLLDAHNSPDLQGFIALAAFIMVTEYAPSTWQRATAFLLTSPMKRSLAHPEDTDWADMLKRLDARLDANLRSQIATTPAP